MFLFYFVEFISLNFCFFFEYKIYTFIFVLLKMDSSIFPFKSIWTLFGNKNREFAIKYTANRKKFFNDELNFKDNIKEHFIFSIGAIYSNNSSPQDITEREFIIDVDLNDMLDNLRPCCKKEKKACVECWKIANFGIKILQYKLKTTFGLKNIFTFFSGSKGYHMYVFDPIIKQFDNEKRKDLYLNLRFEIKSINNSEIIKICLDEEFFIYACNILKIEATNENKIIVLENFWPMLDTQVTIERSHLLKGPFSIHQITGRVARFIKINQNPYNDPSSSSDKYKLFIYSNIEDFNNELKLNCQ